MVQPPTNGLGYRVAVTTDPDRDRLDALLAPLGVPYELFACDPDLADTAQFCAAYGFGLDESANTIVVVGKAEPRVYAACIVLAPHRLDVNRAVKSRLGTRKASFATADETRELTGMAIGGVTPFGLPPDLPVWVDAAVMAQPRIVLGGGSRSWKVIASPAILRALPNVDVVEGLAAPPA
jgi:prolyl-tRNA editing enzyme YbaK/EbsC (Cys-tRNA(Pro) deacylase)